MAAALTTAFVGVIDFCFNFQHYFCSDKVISICIVSKI